MPTRQERSVSMPKNLKLKAARAEKDMTQGTLAEAAGVAAVSVKFWIRHWMNCSGRNKL